jgi:hypothetical protein
MLTVAVNDKKQKKSVYCRMSAATSASTMLPVYSTSSDNPDSRMTLSTGNVTVVLTTTTAESSVSYDSHLLQSGSLSKNEVVIITVVASVGGSVLLFSVLCAIAHRWRKYVGAANYFESIQ